MADEAPAPPPAPPAMAWGTSGGSSNPFSPFKSTPTPTPTPTAAAAAAATPVATTVTAASGAGGGAGAAVAAGGSSSAASVSAAANAHGVKWDIKYTTQVAVTDEDAKGRFSINEYNVTGFLGAGAYARVYKAERPQPAGKPARQFAIKAMNKARLRKVKELKRVAGVTKRVTALDLVHAAIEIMRHLYHRHVTLLFEVIEDPSADDDAMLYMVLEYQAGGDTMLWDNESATFHWRGAPKSTSASRSKPSPLPVNKVRRYLNHVAKGLQYLHANGVIHRDIKPENLLTNERDFCVISDFGVAHKFTPEDAPQGLMSDTAGTYSFLAPEVCAGGEYDAYKVDVWALGVTVFAWTFGKLPFFDDRGMQPLFDAIMTQDLEFPSGAIADTMPPGLRDVMTAMLHKDPAKRPTASQVLEHPWVASYEDLAGKALDAELAARKGKTSSSGAAAGAKLQTS